MCKVWLILLKTGFKTQHEINLSGFFLGYLSFKNICITYNIWRFHLRFTVSIDNQPQWAY